MENEYKPGEHLDNDSENGVINPDDFILDEFAKVEGNHIQGPAKDDQGTNPELIHTADEIMEIISQSDLIERAKQEKLQMVLQKQIGIFERKTEILDRLILEMELIKKKRRLAKKAMKKAKDNKLSKDKFKLIKTHLSQTTEARQHCKQMINQEQKNLKSINAIINLLENAS